MPGMAAMAMGAAPVVGGALLGAAVGQLRGPDLREGIKQDLELLEQMPEIEAARREALRRSINDRIDELIVAEDKARQLRATASSYEGSWRDIVLFALHGALLDCLVVCRPRPGQLAARVHYHDCGVGRGGRLHSPGYAPKRAQDASSRRSWSAVVSGVRPVARAWQHRLRASSVASRHAARLARRATGVCIDRGRRYVPSHCSMLDLGRARDAHGRIYRTGRKPTHE